MNCNKMKNKTIQFSEILKIFPTTHLPEHQILKSTTLKKRQERGYDYDNEH